MDILPFALLLSYTDDVERLLDLKESFNKIRDAHMGAERVATLFIEEYFDVLTEDE